MSLSAIIIIVYEGFNMHPKVSICIPTYKQPDCFKRAISSVLMQTYEDYEIIITDDSPDDSISDALKDFNDNRIKYFKNIERKGSHENFNVAIDYSKGEYIKSFTLF
jgi:glycosyltransferase involved in cell wall biosynthesis